MSQALPREMQPHTYAIMREVEDKHWWYVGRRRIITDFVRRICEELRAEGKREPRILDIGCGTVGSSRVDLQACKLEYSIVSPK